MRRDIVIISTVKKMSKIAPFPEDKLGAGLGGREEQIINITPNTYLINSDSQRSRRG